MTFFSVVCCQLIILLGTGSLYRTFHLIATPPQNFFDATYRAAGLMKPPVKEKWGAACCDNQCLFPFLQRLRNASF